MTLQWRATQRLWQEHPSQEAAWFYSHQQTEPMENRGYRGSAENVLSWNGDIRLQTDFGGTYATQFSLCMRKLEICFFFLVKIAFQFVLIELKKLFAISMFSGCCILMIFSRIALEGRTERSLEHSRWEWRGPRKSFV